MLLQLLPQSWLLRRLLPLLLRLQRPLPLLRLLLLHSRLQHVLLLLLQLLLLPLVQQKMRGPAVSTTPEVYAMRLAAEKEMRDARGHRVLPLGAPGGPPPKDSSDPALWGLKWGPLKRGCYWALKSPVGALKRPLGALKRPLNALKRPSGALLLCCLGLEFAGACLL